MPIYKEDLGKNKEVLTIHAGFGDVHFATLKETESGPMFGLGFYQSKPREIGLVTSNPSDFTTDNIEEPIQVIMRFENPQAITAVIHQLIEVQKTMF